jgi:hypothetical protein
VALVGGEGNDGASRRLGPFNPSRGALSPGFVEGAGGWGVLFVDS